MGGAREIERERERERAGIRRGLLNYTEAREPLVTDTWLSSIQNGRTVWRVPETAGAPVAWPACR